MPAISTIEIVLYCLFVLQTIVAASLIALCVKTEKQINGMKKYKGVIAGFVLSGNPTSPRPRIKPVVEYEVDGSKKLAALNYYSKKMKDGDEIEFYYDSNVSSDAYVTYRSDLITVILFITFCALMLATFTAYWIGLATMR